MGPREHWLPLESSLPSQDPGQGPQEGGESADRILITEVWTCLRLSLALHGHLTSPGYSSWQNAPVFSLPPAHPVVGT